MARRTKRRTTQPRRRRTTKPAETERETRQEQEPKPSSLPEDEVVESSMESFPASDAPAWSGRSSERGAENRE